MGSKRKPARGKLAGRSGDPGGSGISQLQCTTATRVRQVIGDLSRLAALAEAARNSGDYGAYWQLRRQYLLMQAAHYPEGA